MTRLKSAHEHGLQSPVNVTETKLPAEGTQLRAAFDLLYANRGRWIRTGLIAPRARSDLTDYYGCVLEFRGFGRNREMMLAGELFGESAYSSYDGERSLD